MFGAITPTYDFLNHLLSFNTDQRWRRRAVKLADPSLVPAIGDQLRIWPNHSCLTAAMYDRYHVLRGAEIVAEWRPVRGW